MRPSSSLFLPFVAAILFVSCKRDAVSVDFTNANGEVPQLGNLEFRFSKSLVKDSMINYWDSTDYIRFEPKIAGRFRWESPDKLVFSPAQPLLPATTYKASVSKEVLRYTPYDMVNGADNIQFHTPDLALDNTQVIWMLQDEGGRVAIPQMDLYFNYKVSPEDLKDKLGIQVDGTRADYSFLSQAADNKLSVRINGLKHEDRNYETEISIAKGLKPAEGNNPTPEAIRSSLSIPSPYVITIQNVESDHDGEEGTIRVMTSQQLTGEDLKSSVTFSPAVSFSAELTDNGFLLRSDKFDMEKSYSLTVSKGLRGKIGGTLKEDYFGNVVFGELAAGINFTNNKAVYLSKKGARNLEVRITGVPTVRLVISKIYENNLLMAQRYGYYPRESGNAGYASYDEYGEEDYYDYGSSAVLGDVIYDEEIDTRTLPKSNGGRLLNFARFEDRLPDFKGVYHVLIRSTKDYWVRDNRFISVSDIGLIAKQGSDKVVVFANSIKTAGAISGVNVAVYGNNNQLIGTGATNTEGVAEIAVAKKDYDGFRPALVIAKTADDFNYLPFNNTRVNTSRFDVGGKRDNATGLDAFIYPERDIYRPGERVNFSVILRDRAWKAPGDIPVKLKFLLPNGKELKSFRKNLNEQGSLEGSIDLSTAAITGSYVLEVYSSNDILLGSKSFSIEEFVPDRIRVTTRLDKESFKPGETAKLQIHAVNFFGPPAANRNYETEVRIKQKRFSPTRFPDYNFSIGNLKSFYDNQVSEGKTDEEGNATETFGVKKEYANSGVLQATFYTTVFDETGRPVSRSGNADIYTQDAFFGIKDDGYYYYSLNQPVHFQLVSVNKDGNPSNASGLVKVIKHEYRTTLVKSGSYFRYDSKTEELLMTETTMNIAQNTAYNYVPRSPGRYELRVYTPGANTYVSSSFYSYGSWGADQSSFEVNTEGNIDIDLDKGGYYSGETVKASFKTPFNGRLLVTMETDHLVSYQFVDVEKRFASVELPLSSQHLPNVYITATLIKPHEASDIPLTVAHGFKNIRVEEKSRKMAVEIVAQKKVRSRTSQKVTVKAAPGSFVTLAAVDNGVLQVSDFKTPDPYDYFYQKKALQVAAFDLYPLLFAEVRGRVSSTGGDGELSMEKRVNPMPARRVKIMSYWSGIQKANGQGEAKFEFPVPQFSGELRLMAVAYKDDAFGAGEGAITVADPIVISSALPRFMSPGDTVLVPVTLSNTTAKNTDARAAVSVKGPFEIVGESKQNTDLDANSEGQVSFRVAAKKEIGVGKITIQVNGAGEKFLDETELSVRPPSTLQKQTASGSVESGRTERINIPVGDYIPSSVDYRLVVSRSPVIEIADQLRYLVQYPYGCTEQTVSAAFPQLYYGELADLMQLNGGDKENAVRNILEAIRKIKMRQLYNGAVTLWDGGGEPHWWATIYAAHFLLEARKAGYDVDNSLLETMLGYLSSRMKNKELITYYYNRNLTKKIAPKEVPYSLYVLALADRPNISAMNYYKSNKDILALDGKYLLSAAYAAAGDKKSFNAMLPASFAGEESVQQTGGSFYSDVRDEAIALNAIIDVDPGNAQVQVMARHVSDKLKSNRWLNTQERAFSFLALGKLAKSSNQSNATAEIRSGGKTIASVSGGSWQGDMKALKGNNIEMVTKGNGRMYYYWQLEGISASGDYKEEDNYIRVRRRFYNRFGSEITGNTFRQNDLVIVGITLENAYSTNVENIVITDLIPAGFEIENPRTKEIPGMDWIKDASNPTALDVRDDRINLFVDLTRNKQVYYYAVRAVSPGIFKMGPVSADAMYNGEYHSYNGGGTIRINP